MSLASVSGLEPHNFLAVGNPGVGKSTMLNCLMGENHPSPFQADFSPGRGLTFKFDHRTDEATGHRLFDTPGLSDKELRKLAGAAIEEALKQTGKYKVIFVLREEAGRAHEEDSITMQTVLKACPRIGSNYGIIVNKLSRRGKEQLRDKTALGKFRATLFNGFDATAHMFFNERDADLDDAANVIKPLPADLLNFIALQVPTIEIPPECVKPLDTSTMDELKTQLQEANAKLLSDPDALNRRVRELDDTIRALQQQRGLTLLTGYASAEDGTAKVGLQGFKADNVQVGDGQLYGTGQFNKDVAEIGCGVKGSVLDLADGDFQASFGKGEISKIGRWTNTGVQLGEAAHIRAAEVSTGIGGGHVGLDIGSHIKADLSEGVGVKLIGFGAGITADKGWHAETPFGGINIKWW